MEKTVDCPKCGPHMAQGFILDESAAANVVTSWIEGAPKKSFWRGTRVEGKKKIPIAAFRCPKCGYVEFYADNEFAAQ